MTRIHSPEHIYEELFTDLHASQIWEDGKMLSDALPLKKPSEILAAYRTEKNNADFNLETFFNQHFQPSPSRSTSFVSNTEQPIEVHIEQLWDVLTREKDTKVVGSSLLPLPYPYIVPGGRFNEIYYWDSYFTQLGLQQSGRVEMIENMVKNFAHLITTFGYIPNGNRSYFLGRSQPPFFSLMVQLLAQEKGNTVLGEYFEVLEKEYLFWMQDETKVTKNTPKQKQAVYTPDGPLNRYWDVHQHPRPEMHQIDIELAQTTGRDDADLFAHLRAACASGWDFSSRWLQNPQDLTSIQTGEILPIDLNCLLYQLEETLAQSAAEKGWAKQESLYQNKAEKRKQLLRKMFWNEKTGFFHDLWINTLSPTPALTLAGMYPLAFNIARPDQAEACANKIAADFLKDGGVITTLNTTGEQWDAPNGWAPLQWMTFIGLKNYGYDQLAHTIAKRWVKLTTDVYQRTGKCLEKYNVVDTDLLSGGGEYAVQDGFGWTNGVILAFQKKLKSENLM